MKPPKPRKRYGQHYLRDPRYLEAVVRTICSDPEEYFVEIGGGPGVLTERIVSCGKRVEVWEVDRRFEPLLRAVEGVWKVVIGDFLDAPMDYPRRVGFCGNLPYNISSPLIEKVALSGKARVAYFTLQEEFARRLVGGEKKKERSRLTVFVSNFAEVELLFKIPPRAFHPPPKVNSAFVKMLFYDSPLYPWKELKPVVEAGFSERRKKLSSLIARRFGVPKAAMDEFLRREFGSENVRAEEMRIHDFWRVKIFIDEMKGGSGG